MDQPQVMPNINFAKTSEKKTDVLALDKKIATYTGIGLVVFLIVFVVALILNFTIVGGHKRILTSIEEAKKQISALSDEEAKYLMFVEKIQLLSGIQEDRKARKEALDFLNTLLPEEDVMTRVQLDQQAKIITFAVETPDVFAFSRFLAILFSDDVKGKTAFIINTKNVNRDGEGAYTLNAQLDYGLLNTSPEMVKEEL